MANATDSPINGTRTASDIDPAPTSSSSTSETPKTKSVAEIKTNGNTTEHVVPHTNGNGAVSSTHSQSSLSPPPQSSPSTTVSQGDAAQSSFVANQGLNGEHIEEYHSDTPKRDLYVGNLHPRVQLQMLKEIFGGDEMVENVKIVPDRNLSHGGLAYGFVTMVSREAAEEYLERVQGAQFYGLELRINWATPTKSAEQGLSVFVGDIGPDVTVEDLQNAFQDENHSVTDARIVMDPTSGRTKGYGFVTFQDSDAAAKALSKNGEILRGRKMRVNWASTTKDQKPPVVQPPFLPPQDPYAQVMSGMVRLTEPQMTLGAMASFEGLDVAWYQGLRPDIQAGILRASTEAPGAKVAWIGNLDKTINQIDLMPLFTPYGLVEEITMVSLSGFSFVSMQSHLVAATLIVIFKDYILKGRKVKTGWSHSSQRQLHQAVISQLQPHHASPMIQQHIPQIPPHHRSQPSMQMQTPPPQMAPMPPMAPAYMYHQPPMMYGQYMQPMHPYAMIPHPNGTGTSTPRSTTSGSATPSTHELKPKETPSPR